MEITASEAVKKEAYDSLRSIRKIQQKARKELGFLRNATIAHRDSDSPAQYRAIRDLDTNHIFGLASEFYAEAERFIRWMPKLIKETNTMSGLLGQLVAGREINKRGQ
ncbi:MAG: hypothetical protein KC594_18695 [Nitrospira sp.]|nr:hypothetical protein [Nitrospira sp.]